MNKKLEAMLNEIQNTMVLQKQQRILVSNAELEACSHRVELVKIDKVLQEQYQKLNKMLKSITPPE